MGSSTFRVLVVDDYEPWRAFVATMLEKQPELQIIGEAKNGLEAVQIAQQTQPDLILLDIGLPTLNGIEAARRIREVSPHSKILFVSENRSRDIAEEAVRSGGRGYVVKAAAASELLPAIEAVLKDLRFFSQSLAGPALNEPDPYTATAGGEKVITWTPAQNVQTTHHHEVGFYSEDRLLLEKVTQFIGAALQAGDAAIVVATELHRDSLLSRLQAQGLDINAAVGEKRYIELDVAEAVSNFMVHEMADPLRFMEIFGNIIQIAARATARKHSRVVAFGEAAPFLWAQGNAEAAIQTEKLCNQLVDSYGVNILCGYSRDSSRGVEADLFEQIRAEHSGVYSW